MNEIEQAERERLRLEHEYLMSRVIETNLGIQQVLTQLRTTLSGLQALEKIRLLKASELAEFFQVSDNRIYELVRARGLPAISLGDHQMRFDPVAIRRWLDEGGQEFIQGEPQESETVDARSLQVAGRRV